MLVALILTSVKGCRPDHAGDEIRILAGFGTKVAIADVQLADGSGIEIFLPQGSVLNRKIARAKERRELARDVACRFVRAPRDKKRGSHNCRGSKPANGLQKGILCAGG